MAIDKTNDISSIKKEMFSLCNELAKTTRGTNEYKNKATELKKLKALIDERNASLSKTPGFLKRLWNYLVKHQPLLEGQP